MPIMLFSPTCNNLGQIHEARVSIPVSHQAGLIATSRARKDPCFALHHGLGILEHVLHHSWYNFQLPPFPRSTLSCFGSLSRPANFYEALLEVLELTPLGILTFEHNTTHCAQLKQGIHNTQPHLTRRRDQIVSHAIYFSTARRLPGLCPVISASCTIQANFLSPASSISICLIPWLTSLSYALINCIDRSTIHM